MTGRTRQRVAGPAQLVLVRFTWPGTASCFLPMPLDWTHGDLLEGLRCFHSGAYFEAHEHWESVWLTAREPEKTFLQALIQVAASFHHFQRGNHAGTISLLRIGLAPFGAISGELWRHCHRAASCLHRSMAARS